MIATAGAPGAAIGRRDVGVGGNDAPRGFRVRGQPAAASAAALVRSARTHALLLVGPAGIGKTTLALDLAALLLCGAPPDERPCRACRGCRQVETGNHPDLHRLAPDGPGGQIRIGSRTDAEPGTVRRLIADLALLPVEGGARVAIVEHADRLNEDAQSALLKTLEEPPARTWLFLCADEEERLLPTVRSRCARVRLGSVGARQLEALLEELGGLDAPSANRLGRLAGGRPGVALTWARAPEAVTARGEIARTLLDLLVARRAERLSAVRTLLARAGEAAAALANDARPQAQASGRRGRKAADGRARPAREDDGIRAPDGRGTGKGGDPAGSGTGGDPAGPGTGGDPAGPGTDLRRAPPAERRRAAMLLVDVWRDVARDMALVGLGEARGLRDPGLLDDLRAVPPRLAPGSAGRFLLRLDAAGELIESNVNPELVVDSLVLAWPGPASAPGEPPA